MYGYHLLSPFKFKIALLHLGQYLGSTVMGRLGHHPGLPHSLSNIHHRVAVTVYGTIINPAFTSTQLKLAHWGQTIGLNRHGQGLPPWSPEYLLIHSHPSHPVILCLLTHSFLAQSQNKITYQLFIINQS
jgi:hypothetical protein